MDALLVGEEPHDDGLSDEDFRASPLRRYAASALDRMEWRRGLYEATYRLSVVDDGKGIDRARIEARLDEAPSNAGTLLDLLCVEGLSTATDVTELAGRGVGISAVRETVRQLGGTMDVKTVLGQGTTFTLSVPVRM